MVMNRRPRNIPEPPLMLYGPGAETTPNPETKTERRLITMVSARYVTSVQRGVRREGGRCAHQLQLKGACSFACGVDLALPDPGRHRDQLLTLRFLGEVVKRKGHWSETGVRLAQKLRVGPCIPVGIQLEKTEAGPTSGPTWHLSHLATWRRGAAPARPRTAWPARRRVISDCHPNEGASKNRTQIPIIHRLYVFSAPHSLG
jgi:hypothetical protein